TYKGKLVYTPASRSRKCMFVLNLHPLQRDHTSRLQGIFGAHRFLYLDVPNISRPTSEFKGHASAIQQRFREWLETEKEFLGYRWRPFHVQVIKGQSRKSDHLQAIKGHSKKPDHAGGQRVVLFATHGLGLEPISLYQLLNWIIPLNENAHQPFCKAYAQLDLFMSRSTPTVKFKPGQVRHVKDVRANKVPEDMVFNDPAISIPACHSSSTSMVMNDGCSLMSVGATKEMCTLLGLSGTRPVTFQGRINGCKGMWTISAPYDSTDPDHQDVWIEITESQQKIVPRGQDRNPSTCDADRWTFDLVDYSTPPTPSNLYLDFMPILEDRHVPRGSLCGIVRTQLDMDFEDLFRKLDDHSQLREWVHSQFASLEESNRLTGIKWEGAFPSETLQKVILLLDSEFHPKTCHQLAACLKTLVQMWTHQLREKLKVRLPSSTSVYGIADPTGSLKPGEIYLGFSKTFRDETENADWSFLCGEVLVARHPSLRRSDIQKVKAVYKEELSHLRDVVVFPRRGSHPLADKLQGGDYDGDTFWVCWDHRITKPFMNAPPPDPNSSPELGSFCIERDDRRLKEILGPGTDDVDAWLSLSFGFKLQEDMLGQVTNARKRLAYQENRIHTPKVCALVDLHDLIINSAKNGYKFDSEAFANFKKLRHIRDAPKTDYEKEPTVSKTKSVRHNTSRSRKHIIDKVYFEIVDPRIEAMQKRLDTLLTAAHTSDDDLARPYLACKEEATTDHLVDQVLQNLVAALDAVVVRWKRSMNPGTDLDSELGKKVKEKCYSECYELYRGIGPSRIDHERIKEWMRPRIAHDFTTWDLLKASTFYYTQHMDPKLRTDRSTTLVFFVAGKELCEIKAKSRPGGRTLAQSMYANLKPRKKK
ncbi:RNA dependent RNA polymerase-domain-containing protein, partial [Delphinella strobiligena]